jgi:hypothetical protein
VLSCRGCPLLATLGEGPSVNTSALTANGSANGYIASEEPWYWNFAKSTCTETPRQESSSRTGHYTGSTGHYTGSWSNCSSNITIALTTPHSTLAKGSGGTHIGQDQGPSVGMAPPERHRQTLEHQAPGGSGSPWAVDLCLCALWRCAVPRRCAALEGRQKK